MQKKIYTTQTPGGRCTIDFFSCFRPRFTIINFSAIFAFAKHSSLLSFHQPVKSAIKEEILPNLPKMPLSSSEFRRLRYICTANSRSK
jgi:hypothetical protein